MKNIQIFKLTEGYRIKLHYGTKDLEMVSATMDNVIQKICDFFVEDGQEVSDLSELKVTCDDYLEIIESEIPDFGEEE